MALSRTLKLPPQPSLKHKYWCNNSYQVGLFRQCKAKTWYGACTMLAPGEGSLNGSHYLFGWLKSLCLTPPGSCLQARLSCLSSWWNIHVFTQLQKKDMFIILINSWRVLCSALKSQVRIGVEPSLLNVIISFNKQPIANIDGWLAMCQALFEVIYNLFSPYKDHFLPLLFCHTGLLTGLPSFDLALPGLFSK